ncbi:MAG: DegT/DnrJ/EryC1/StrS family aminotransferase [Spirosomataceae bacterium]
MKKSETIGLYGGDKTINIPTPHYRWPIISEETSKAVNKQLYTSISIYDKSGIIKEFENKFKDYHNKKYGLLCNSGTSALYTMYKSIGLMPDDEIICPIYTFFATVTPVLFTGAKPVFCDCLDNGNIDPQKIEEKITNKTKAIVVTHMWGIPCQMSEIVFIAKKYNLKVLEDCSHAHGATYKGQLVGTFGDAAIWSLQGQKIVSGGEGGIILTDDIDIYVKSQLIGHYNERCTQEIPEDHPLFKYSITGFGQKFRIHPIAVAIANQQFNNLSEWLEQKRSYAQKFIAKFKDNPILEPLTFNDSNPSWYAFILKVKKNIVNSINIDTLYDAFQEEGLYEIDRPFSTAPLNFFFLFKEPYHAFPEFYKVEDNFIKDEEYNVSFNFFSTIFKIPVWAEASDKDIVDLYIKGINKVCNFAFNNPELFKNNVTV